MTVTNNAYHLRCMGGGVFVCFGRFYPDTANDPTGLRSTGSFVSAVEHTATGKYTLTLRDTPYQLLAVIPSISVVGDATDATAQGGVEDGNTIVIKTKAGGTNTDFAADDDTHVDFMIVFRNADRP